MAAAKRKFRNYQALLIGIFLSLILAEIMFRIIPNQANHYGTTIRYEKNEKLGYALAPNPSGTLNLTCSRINNIYINSFGFRDTEWKKDGKPKIAIMGDSFMEALQVADNETTCSLLEKLLGIEIMNASISGYGTVAQYLAYKNVIKQFHPEAVLVFFYPDNDFMNNECHLDVKTGNYRNEDCPCAIVSQDGKVELLTKYPDDVIPKRQSWLEQHWLTYYYIKNRFFPESYLKTKEAMQYFFEPWTGHFHDSELITKEVLDLFRKEVEADGAKFYLFAVPDEYHTCGKNWQQIVKVKSGWDSIPDNFNLELPMQKLEEIAKSLSLNYFDMNKDFNSYLDSNQVPNRMLSYSCNDHWNPLGHYVAAHSTALHLLTIESIGLDSLAKINLIAKIQQNLKMDPHKILPSKNWEEIYNHGIYTGNSNVSEKTISRNGD